MKHFEERRLAAAIRADDNRQPRPVGAVASKTSRFESPGLVDRSSVARSHPAKTGPCQETRVRIVRMWSELYANSPCCSPGTSVFFVDDDFRWFENSKKKMALHEIRLARLHSSPCQIHRRKVANSFASIPQGHS